MDIKRINPGARMSQAVVHGDTVYLAGHVAQDTTADVAGQTQQILARIEEVLSQAGSDKSRLLSATIWLADVNDYDAINEVWDAWVVPGNPPARACVESKLAGSEYRIEIAVIAARG
jgi:enamine deaminase RidA (YjgF/YER057c/UK114 family)